METLRVLMLGDLVGTAGRAVFAKHIKSLKEKHAIDAVIVNGENSSNQGRGITPAVADFFKEHGVDCVTTGNHVWHRHEIYPYLEEHKYVLRPANFPAGTPGVGVMTFHVKGHTIAVINVQGRIFMRENVDDPFRVVDSLLMFLKDKTPIIFIDFHAEATSEKHAMAYYCAGRVSGVVGTHTHVQTADERVLPGGTAYISDLGMGGALNSMLGMQRAPIIQHFLTQLPVKFMVDTQAPFVLCGAIITVDTSTGRATKIERVRIIDETLQVNE